MPAFRRGRRVSVSELRFQKRVLHKQEERDQRENLHLIRDGVLAGVLRVPKGATPEAGGFLKLLQAAKSGTLALAAIGSVDYRGRLGFTDFVRSTRLLEPFDDETAMAVASKLRVYRLAKGAILSHEPQAAGSGRIRCPGEDYYTIVLQGVLQLQLPRRHQRSRFPSLTGSDQLGEEAQAKHNPGLQNVVKAIVGANRLVPTSSKMDEVQLMEHEVADMKFHAKAADEVCNLHAGDALRTGFLIVKEDREPLAACAVHGDALVLRIPTVEFERAVCSVTQEGRCGLAFHELVDRLQRMSLFSGLHDATLGTLAVVARETAEPAGHDAAAIKPAFATGQGELANAGRHVIVRQNAPSRSLYLLLSGPCTVVRNIGGRFANRTRPRRTTVETASSRQLEDDQAELQAEAQGEVRLGDLPADQPMNEELYDASYITCANPANWRSVPISNPLVVLCRTLSAPTFFGESALVHDGKRDATVLASFSLSKMIFLRNADALFFLDMRTVERVKELAEFRVELKNGPSTELPPTPPELPKSTSREEEPPEDDPLWLVRTTVCRRRLALRFHTNGAAADAQPGPRGARAEGGCGRGRAGTGQAHSRHPTAALQLLWGSRRP